VNLGCGTLKLEGWINLDLVGLPVDVAWNLERRLPFDDASIDAIFQEHVLEHLSAPMGLWVLDECFRVLKPGGIMRVVVPDASKYIRSYCDPSHEFLTSWRHIDERRLPPLLGVQEEFYGFGHRTIYDFETLALFSRASGFAAVEQRAFGEGKLQPCPDSAWREADSCYAEMEK